MRFAVLNHKARGRCRALDWAVPSLPSESDTSDDARARRAFARDMESELDEALDAMGESVPVGLSVVVFDWVDGAGGHAEDPFEFNPVLVEAQPLPDDRLAWVIPDSALA